MKWVKCGSLTLEIEETRFAHGAFRDAFRATTIGKDAAQTAWVVKRYQEEAVKTIKDDLGMSLEDHTRKQVQMSAVARHLTKRFAKNVPPEFGGTLEYVKVFFFFAVFKKQPVTIEEFVQGEFHRYVNNNGFHIPSHQWSLMRFMKRHNALCITAIRYLKRSLCCLIFRVPFLSCTIQKLQQQIFLLMMHHWIQRRSTSVLATFPVLQLMTSNQNTLVTSTVT